VAVESGELPATEFGSMAYMMSTEAYLSNRVGRWLPHLMFFTSETDPKSWGAGLPGSPMIGIKHPEEHFTVLIVPLSRWSDRSISKSEEH